MGVSIDKVRREAPHMVKLVEQTGVVLDKKGIDPTRYKAAVIGTFDHSGSTEFPENRLYSRGIMQEVADIAFAAGLTFDDDGRVPVSLFDNNVSDLGEITLGNCRGFMGQHSRYRFGGTEYKKALEWIVQTAGFGHVNLGAGGGRRGLFSKGSSLEVKATAPYPTYALFVTDGEPSDPHAAEEYLRLMSQLPIFVQFVGVGTHRFEFLQKLDDLDGRLIDNADFFDAKDADHQQGRMLELMLNEFPGYYANAKRSGLLV